MGRGFQVWKFHLKISPWEEKPCLPRAYGPWEASFSSRGLIFGGEEISIPETRPIQKSYICYELIYNSMPASEVQFTKMKALGGEKGMRYVLTLKRKKLFICSDSIETIAF